MFGFSGWTLLVTQSLASVLFSGKKLQFWYKLIKQALVNLVALIDNTLRALELELLNWYRSWIHGGWMFNKDHLNKFVHFYPIHRFPEFTRRWSFYAVRHWFSILRCTVLVIVASSMVRVIDPGIGEISRSGTRMDRESWAGAREQINIHWHGI